MSNEIFDAHLHIIDPAFPLTPNQGYLPDAFTVDEYLTRMQVCSLRGGAVVSGSFQGFDQGYLRAALARLGPSFVGVTQLPATVSDEELLDLDSVGVRALRFNLKRGGSEEAGELERMAVRVHELVHWHVELYADAAELQELEQLLLRLPAVSIDHLGLSARGLPLLCRLAEGDVRIKATGFGRVDFDVAAALRNLHAANPRALMFGSDLPSTRAPRPFDPADLMLIADSLGEAAQDVLLANAWDFYRMDQVRTAAQ